MRRLLTATVSAFIGVAGIAGCNWGSDRPPSEQEAEVVLGQVTPPDNWVEVSDPTLGPLRRAFRVDGTLSLDGIGLPTGYERITPVAPELGPRWGAYDSSVVGEFSGPGPSESGRCYITMGVVANETPTLVIVSGSCDPAR